MNPAEQSVLADLGVILLAATAVALLARGLRLPSIVGYLLAGLALGPGLGVIPGSETIDVISEAGIILLLFLVGLELSVDKVRKVGRISLGAGVLQMVATGLGVALIGRLFGLAPAATLFLAVALTFSSTVVVVKLLDQMDSLDARHGRIAVGILLFQDVAVLIVLTTAAGLGRTGDFDAAVVLVELARAFGGMLVLFGGAAVASAMVLPRMFTWAGASQETVLIWSLAWCFALVLGAGTLGLSPELGAFVAGVGLADLPHSVDLRRRVHPFMAFFVAVFFVTLGLHVDLGAALSAWPLIIALSLFTLVAKPLFVGWAVRRSGESPATAVRAGVALAQTSEFSFLLGALALELGVVGDDLLAVVAGVGLVTMGLSSFFISNQEKLVGWLAHAGVSPILSDVPEEGQSAPLGGHVIVVGMNSLGRGIVEALASVGEPTLAVDTDPGKLADLPCPTVLGNAEYLSVLEDAGISRAKLLVSALRIEDVNRLLAYRAHSFGVPAAIHVYDQVSESEFTSLGVAHVLDSRTAGIRRIAEALQQEGVFG